MLLNSCVGGSIQGHLPWQRQGRQKTVLQESGLPFTVGPGNGAWVIRLASMCLYSNWYDLLSYLLYREVCACVCLLQNDLFSVIE